MIFKFEPHYFERVWGGQSLNEILSRKIPSNQKIGEAWDLVDREGCESLISHPQTSSNSIRNLLESNSEEIMGPGWDKHRRFPILVKWLDCTDRLSLQVHPPSSIASSLGGEPKTENWYIMHAIDAGNLILEIQQNSDTTYRVYDWGRKDEFGNSRNLHIEESLKCIDFEDFNAHLIEPQKVAEQVLADCKHFRIRKFKIESGSSISLKTQNEQCVLLNPLGSSIKIGGTYLASGELGLSPYCEACTISCVNECDVLVTDNFFNPTSG